MMSHNAIVYFIFTVILGLVFAGIIVYTYGRKRKDRIEEPKHRMLEDEEDQ